MSPTPIDPVAGLSGSKQYVAGLLDGYVERFDLGTDRTKVGGLEREISFNGTIINSKNRQDRVILTSIDGLSDADIRDTRETNPGADGETAFRSYYGGRTIVLNGYIRAGSLEKLRDMQEGLKTVFSALDEAPLVFRGVSRDKDLQILCRKSQPITMSEAQQSQLEFKREFQITLRASDFRFTSTINNEYGWKREYDDAVKEDIPSFYLRLNETSGTYAADSSGFNRAGTISGANYSASGAVLGGASYDFDGVNDYVSTSYMPFASGTTIRTYEAWVYRDTNSSVDTIIGSSSTTSNDQFSISLGSGNDTLTVKLNGSVSKVFASCGIGTGAWKYLVVVVNCATSSITAYVNGSSISGTGTVSGSYSASPGNLLIGCVGSASNSFDGKIAEVAVYDKLLTTDQITSHYRAATNCFSGQVFMTTVTNNGNYLADPIIKIQGPVYATASGAVGGLIITNKADEIITAGITAQAFETSADAEIFGDVLPSKISVDSYNKTIIQPVSDDAVAPYTVIDENHYILINTRKKTVNRYNKLTNQFVDSIFSQVNTDSEWIKLAPGANPLYIECTANSNPQITVYFKDTFI